MAGLTCPKCGSEMRSYERNGITVDQCSGCRGVFLDRGELERLIDAEGAFYEQRSAPAPQPPPSFPPPRSDYGHRHQSHHHGKRRKKSFLDEFLDFG